MKTLHRMIIKDFIPTLLVSMIFFVLILQLVDIFANLWRYLNADVSLKVILQITLLYMPKCISFALPIALLFSISYTLGNYYANNELIAVFGSGFSLYQLTMPLLVIALFLSFGSYFFEDRIVIPTLKDKNRMSREVLGQTVSYSNSNVAVLSHRNRVIYNADFYNDRRMSLTGVTVLFLDDQGRLELRVDGNSAQWEDGRWIIKNARVFSDGEEFMVEEFFSSWEHELLDEPPDSFKRITRDVAEMTAREAKDWVESLRRTGFPYKGVLTEYYQRVSFALTPLVVALLSCSLGGRFKKNILLMSLLSSLVVSVIYYVAQMIMVLLAKLGYIPPIYGAWAAFLVFLGVGVLLFRTAQT
ncbi:MAG: LptF/LptG family permease [Spirochaetales bacterium]|nr:LptF/LptG family permease [Spirochaetales bacterium]